MNSLCASLFFSSRKKFEIIDRPCRMFINSENPAGKFGEEVVDLC